MAAHAVLKARCDYESSRIRSVAIRFAAPVYPGEFLRFGLWRGDEGRVYLRSIVDSRNADVLTNGVIDLDC